MSISTAGLRTLTATANELIQTNLRDGAEIRFTVPTRSMLPMLAPGDRVIVRGLSANEPRVGDVVLVNTRQSWLAHRVIERHGRDRDALFVTKGDNCTSTDEVWSPDALCGIILSVQREGNEASFHSKRARGLGTALAHLSRWQWQSDQMRPGLWKNIAYGTSSVLVRGMAWLAQIGIGLKWGKGI